MVKRRWADDECAWWGRDVCCMAPGVRVVNKYRCMHIYYPFAISAVFV